MARAAASKSKHLKNAIVLIVSTYIVWCLSVYAVFFTGYSSFFQSLTDRYHALNRKDGLVLIMMPVVILVLSGVISSHWKAVLVFWRLKHPLPGHRAFSILARNDPRIDMQELKRKFGDLPRGEKDQNAVWYKAYKKVETATIVVAPHRSFLLARDLAAIALLFALGGSVGLLVVHVNARLVAVYAGAMLAQYLFLAIVARNHGKRLVCNVLVEFQAKE